MKIRIDFITNSSSSSFIVAFDKVPESIEELKKLLFGNERIKANWDGSISFSTWELTEIIFEIMQKQNGKPFKDTMINEVRNSHIPEFPKFDSKKSWEEEKKEREKIAKEVVERFIEKTKGNKYYLFSFGDNHGVISGDVGSVLEQEDIFSRLPHLYLNQH